MTDITLSSESILSLLSEDSYLLKYNALSKLHLILDYKWMEFSNSLAIIESLYEDKNFNEKKLASIIISKIYYHLEELDDSLKYALTSEELFDVSKHSQYVDTLISKCIDKYIELRISSQIIDPKLESIVNRMFQRCYNEGEYKHAMGIALESRRLDKIAEIVTLSSDTLGMLNYCTQLALQHISHRDFRKQVLQLIVDLYSQQASPDYIAVCQALFILDNANSVATILEKLLRGNQDDTLMAFQVAFDLAENQNQPFLYRVVSSLPPVPTKVVASTGEDVVPLSVEQTAFNARLVNLVSILTGELPTELYLQFLFNHQKSDPLIIKTIKDKQEVKNSVTNSCTVMSHALMQCGTTVDTFLRENLDWLGRATNWGKFTATASIGVIHKGHRNESMKLLGSYLPSVGSQGSVYQEGGALYALGLIHANHGGDQIDYFMEQIRSARDEVIKHGACLGLGLAAMATGREEILEELLNSVVYQDDAVAGEAAALAMGLIMAGYGNTKLIDEMLQFAHDTKHEKIIRGIGLGIAMSVYGLEENADGVIERLFTDKDAVLRYSAVYAIAMAYVGTSNNDAIRKLLLLAVSDVSDDVRRASVTAIGFVMCNNHKQVPRVVELLAESFNPYVRYGSAMAVGISAAGTGSNEALNLLVPLCKDRVDFVRQAAFIATAMVLIQVNGTADPRATELRKQITETLDNKFADPVTKMGAILAAGILDGGGRNCTLSLLSGSGHKKMASIIGMAMFCQFWYWYPLTHFISLSFTPTAVIGLTKDLQLPKNWSFTSQAKPSLFAYPPLTEVKKEVKVKKAPTATLSVTAKAKAKAKAKGKDDSKEEEKEGAMDIEKSADSMEVESDVKEGDNVDTKKKEKVPEPAFEVLSNPSRVTFTQQKLITVDVSQRYKPLIPAGRTLSGFILLKDTQPDLPEEFITTLKPKTLAPDEVEEASPFEPFEYTL